jgi:hypothetical protein
MIKKTFEFKGQAINYFNKVKATNATKGCYELVSMCFDWDVKKYVVTYIHK